MTDNSAALAQARRRDSNTKRARARTALQELIEAGAPITFTALARRAGVSVSLLYADKDLAAAVADARDRQRQAGAGRAWRLPARSLITEQSLRADLANAKEQIRQLHEEAKLLRQRLTRSLGTEADIARGRATAPLLDQLEDRAAELEADNHQLRRRVTELETELRETVDSLCAARAANRDLINMINR
jgi:chromosome segregation ATPase